MDVSSQHGRVLACLIEKAETTPDSYPLSSNALCAACNQSSNRDPVVDYSERDVDAIMLELRQGGLARTVTGSGHRVGKHKHVVDEALSLDGEQLAVLAVLLLRGDQTRNEITTRTARYAGGPAGDVDAVDAAIERLTARSDPLAVRLERRPGEREARIAQCWAATHDGAAPLVPARVDAADQSTTGADLAAPAQERATPAAVPVAPPDESDESDEVAALTSRVDALEAALAEQNRRLDELLEDLGD